MWFRLTVLRLFYRRRSVNERITAPMLLIVWEKQEGGGKDSVVMSRRKALQLAKDNELDLVLREYKRVAQPLRA